MHNDPNWRETYRAYIKSKGKLTKHLSFRGFGMNMGIWHYKDGDLLNKYENLESIDLGDNYIDTVVFDFSKFKRLTRIDLNSNALYYWGQEGSFRIHEQIRAPNLKWLSLAEGKLGYIILSKEAAFRNSLEWLDLSGNEFTGMSSRPEGPPVLKMTNLPKLKYLGLRDNLYTFCPKLRWFHTLPELDLSNNPIRSNWQELLKMPNLRILHLAGCKLEEIPEVFREFGFLKQLDLSYNWLEDEQVDELRSRLPHTEIIFKRR